MLAILSAVSPIVNKVLDLIPNQKDRDKAALELTQLQTQIILEKDKAEAAAREKQLEINLAEAGSESLFKSGWRPFIGWGCGIIVVLNCSIAFIASMVALFGVNVVLPDINSATTIASNILAGLLGLGMGAMRSSEKKLEINKKAFYDSLRVNSGKPLNQGDVAILEKALDSSMYV